MVIKRNTRYLDVANILQYASADTLVRISSVAPDAVFGDGGYYAMTLGQFGLLLNGASPIDVIAHGSFETLTCFEYYAIQGLADFVKQYTEQLVNLTPKPINGETIANTLPVSAAEGLLIFAREYFGHHSFADAEKTTLGDLLIAKKDSYNKVMIQRAQIARMRKGGKYDHR